MITSAVTTFFLHCYLINFCCLWLLVGVDVGNRWKELYHLWESHTDDHILVRAVISLRMRFNFVYVSFTAVIRSSHILRLHTSCLSHVQNYL